MRLLAVMVLSAAALIAWRFNKAWNDAWEEDAAVWAVMEARDYSTEHDN